MSGSKKSGNFRQLKGAQRLPNEMTNRRMNLGKYSITLLFVAWCILNLAAQVSADGTGNKRDKRSRKNVRDTMYLNRGATENCFDAYRKCRKIPKCKAALQGLKDKCNYVAGKCSAKMVDLPRCGQIMDHLFEFGFPEETQCACEHREKRCYGLLNKIYANPCFAAAKRLREKPKILDTGKFESTTSARSSTSTPTTKSTSGAVAISGKPVDEFDLATTASIKHLRTLDLFPKEVNAYDKVSGYIPSPSTTAQVNEESVEQSSVNPDEDEDTLLKDYDRFVFGDEGLAEPPPPRRREDSDGKEEDKGWLEEDKNKKIAEVVRDSNKASSVTTAVESPRYTESDSVSASETQDIIARQQGRQGEDPAEKRRKESDTDFKMIAIVLGVLLGVFILCLVIFFAWTRARGAFLYTSGKLVRDHRTDEGTRTKLPPRPSTGLPADPRQSRA